MRKDIKDLPRALKDACKIVQTDYVKFRIEEKLWKLRFMLVIHEMGSRHVCDQLSLRGYSLLSAPMRGWNSSHPSLQGSVRLEANRDSFIHPLLRFIHAHWGSGPSHYQELQGKQCSVRLYCLLALIVCKQPVEKYLISLAIMELFLLGISPKGGNSPNNTYCNAIQNGILSIVILSDP